LPVTGLLTASDIPFPGPIANTWTVRPGTAQILNAPIYDSSQPAYATIATPLHAYGVIVFIKAYSQNSPAQMWLYKP
jgi:hypothetical protein